MGKIQTKFMNNHEITTQNPTILITDDSDINRMILMDILGEDYEILEAADGEEALSIVEERADAIDLILLDCVMPKVDGFQVLLELSRNPHKRDIPVIMISAENDQAFITRAYKLGAVDYISRPFNAAIVRHRIDIIMRMHRKEQYLAEIASREIIAKHQNNSMMIHILSGIVEFRNGESGSHILHVQTLTDMLMHEMLNTTDQYPLTDEEITMIPLAAALHDVGKISVPYKILNKPGRFTDEEFEVMKNHTVAGYEMLNAIEGYKDDPLIKLSAQVCRWHHERYDGKGYPDGLVGDAIPIAAQLVSLADVYDALTSERCYKPPYSHDQTILMILDGDCGIFNPILLKCLQNLAPEIPARLANTSVDDSFREDITRIIEKTLRPGKGDTKE